jgi:hypothetical protein
MGENVVIFEEVNKSNAQQQLMRLLCQLLQVKPEELAQIGQRLCAVEKLQAQCNQVTRLVGKTCCVGNVQYSQLTLDGYSDKDKVSLSEVVKDFGPDFVNSFPVAPGKSIRLTHEARPGYLPDRITLSLALANNANNYMDIRVQLYVVPNNGSSTDPGKPIGSVLEGSDFLELNGQRIVVNFPTYRGEPIIIGSSERLAATITHRGGVNAINSASLAVFYDNTAFFAGCCANCGRGESCSCSVQPPKQLPPG